MIDLNQGLQALAEAERLVNGGVWLRGELEHEARRIGELELSEKDRLSESKDSRRPLSPLMGLLAIPFFLGVAAFVRHQILAQAPVAAIGAALAAGWVPPMRRGEGE